MNQSERYSGNIQPLLDSRAGLQVAYYLDTMKKRLNGGKAALLWDWNNTLVDNFWIRLNKIKELYERNYGTEVEIPDDIYKHAEASITLATGILNQYYPGIEIFPVKVNDMMESNKLETPIKDPKLPSTLQELEKTGFPSIGIITGSKQQQLSIIKRQLLRNYPQLGDIPVLLYPEWNDIFSHGKSQPIPKDYELTLLWKKIVASRLQPLLQVPLILIDNEPRQADLLSTSDNRQIIGVPFGNDDNIRQRIEQSLYLHSQ